MLPKVLGQTVRAQHGPRRLSRGLWDYQLEPRTLALCGFGGRNLGGECVGPREPKSQGPDRGRQSVEQHRGNRGANEDGIEDGSGLLDNND